MREAGLVPGATVTLDFGPSTITVRAEGAKHSMVFSRDLATHLFVAA
jgi:hypothetical protein